MWIGAKVDLGAAPPSWRPAQPAHSQPWPVGTDAGHQLAAFDSGQQSSGQKEGALLARGSTSHPVQAQARPCRPPSTQ